MKGDWNLTENIYYDNVKKVKKERKNMEGTMDKTTKPLYVKVCICLNIKDRLTDQVSYTRCSLA